MSSFHGGFLLTRIDPDVLERTRRATAAYLTDAAISIEDLTLSYATRLGSPWLLMSVHGGPADGKGACFFHYDHAALGGVLAVAIDAPVVAYAYENQTGFEMTVSFDETGRVVTRDEASWDEMAAELGLAPGDGERLRRALPLGRLTDAHAVPRALLEDALAYDTPACRVSLIDVADPDVLARYLGGPLLGLPRAPRVEPSATLQVYFDGALLREAKLLATELSVSLGVLFSAAWEDSKETMFRTIPGVEDETFLPPPAAHPPEDLVIPDHAADLSPLVAANDKVAVGLALDPRTVGEIDALAVHTDRTRSWMLRRAWQLARARLHAAKRPE